MSKSKKIRNPVISGSYYPSEKKELEAYLKVLFEKHFLPKIGSPFALIAPAETYTYTGELYANAYSQIMDEQIDTVIIISPKHKLAFQGIALSDSDAFSTPMGEIAVDAESSKYLNKFNPEFIIFEDKHHENEHSIEAQLPFIQHVLGNNVKILPVIIGETNTKFTIMLANALNSLINKSKKRFLIVIATNLSASLKYEIAKAKDEKFMQILLNLNADYLAEQLALGEIQAFGGGGIIALLRLMETLEIKNIRVLKAFNSGDLNNEKNKVDGYFSAIAW